MCNEVHTVTTRWATDWVSREISRAFATNPPRKHYIMSTCQHVQLLMSRGTISRYREYFFMLCWLNICKYCVVFFSYFCLKDLNVALIVLFLHRYLILICFFLFFKVNYLILTTVVRMFTSRRATFLDGMHHAKSKASRGDGAPETLTMFSHLAFPPRSPGVHPWNLYPFIFLPWFGSLKKSFTLDVLE